MTLSEIGNKYSAQAKGGRVKKLSLFFLMSLILLLFSQLGLTSPLETLGGRLTTPAKAPVFRLHSQFSEFLSGLGAVGRLQEDNKQLREENRQLQAELAEVELVFSRYQDLKDELGEGYEREYGLIPALVIGRESGNVNSITINKGSTDGVEQGSAVVVDGYLLGRVEDVSGRYSLVSLLIDTSTSIPVKNVNESLGILKAQGGNQLLVDQILPGKTIEQGQPVFTSGLNSQYPPDLLVGEVSTIQADSREPTVSVELSSEISWGEIDNVTVLKQL